MLIKHYKGSDGEKFNPNIIRRLGFPTPGLFPGHYLRCAPPSVGHPLVRHPTTAEGNPAPYRAPLYAFCLTPHSGRGNNSEKRGNCPGTNQDFTTGIGEVMYSNVLLASARTNLASAKPRGPGGGARIGDQGSGTAGACQSLLNSVSIRSRMGCSVTRIPRLRLWSRDSSTK